MTYETDLITSLFELTGPKVTNLTTLFMADQVSGLMRPFSVTLSTDISSPVAFGDSRKTTHFHAVAKSRSITRSVAKLQHGSIAAGQSDTWEGEQLLLPALPPSFIIGCGIMSIRYTLELRVFPVGPAFELAVPLEIILGTAPLQSTVQSYWTSHHHVLPSTSVTGAVAEAAQRQPLYLYPTFSPSTMCPSHVRDDEDSHITTHADKDFSPKYIMFNFHLPPHPNHFNTRHT